MNAQEWSNHLKGKPQGQGRYMALCPAHDDKTPSLSIKDGDDGNTLIFCHAGCDTKDVVAAAGYKMSDLFATPLKGYKNQSNVIPEQWEHIKTVMAVAESHAEHGIQYSPDDQKYVAEAKQTLLKEFEPTEDGIALAFVAEHELDLRFDHTRKKWFEFKDGYWQEDGTHRAFSYARNKCREFKKLNPNANLSNVRTAGGVERFAQSDQRIAVTGEIWNQDPWIIGTPAGTVELKSGTLRQSNPNDYINKITSVSPDNSPTPRWNRFLKEVANGDETLIRFIQQIAGYCLTGSIKEHALFFLYGPGGNGKGVLVDILTAVCGDYAKAASMTTFTASKHDSHPTDLAYLHGARLVTASETEEGRAWAESRIKQLTGGDPVSARYMRQDFFEFIPEFKLLFLGNHKPALHNIGEAERRRFHIIPFNYKPPVVDKDLKDKLSEELSGIFHWAIEGCLDWQKNGLIVPEVVKNETEEYFNDQDTFAQWLEECTEHGIGETSERLFASWKQWATQQGEFPGAMASFSQRMAKAGYTKTKHTPGQRGKRGFNGVILKGKPDEYQPYSD